MSLLLLRYRKEANITAVLFLVCLFIYLFSLSPGPARASHIPPLEEADLRAPTLLLLSYHSTDLRETALHEGSLYDM